jgi:crotonobetaine/carnitine-CoA ligase
VIANVEILPQRIGQVAAEDPDCTFIELVDGPSISYGSFHEEARRWASALERLGVEPGQQVAWMLPNGIDAALAWLGTAWLRARSVPVNVAYRGRMLQYTVDHSQAAVVVVSERYLDRLAEVAAELPRVTTVVVADADQPEHDLPFTVLGRGAFLEGATAQDRPEPRRHDIAGVFYTSGTTGASKGVLVPWAQLHGVAWVMTRGLDGHRGWYSPLPMFHISGIAPVYATALLADRIVVREAFSIGDFLDDVVKYDCSTTIAMGAMVQFLLNQPASERDRQTPLRYVGMAPVPQNIDEFRERFGVSVYTGWNMTEASVPICSDGWTVDGSTWPSCGRVRPGMEVRLVDEHDEEVGIGELGELIVRADDPWTLNVGYLHMPDKTAEAWRNGWFHSGDAFTRDADGNYFYVDRQKDAIRRRGENISSMEVEVEVNAHPDVLESAAVATPSELSEDEVKVFVVPKTGAELTPEGLTEFLVPRMPHYMVPRYVEIVDELPKTPTMKVKKHELRALGNSDRTWDREAAGIILKRQG